MAARVNFFLIASWLIVSAKGHGGLVTPTSRNAVDRELGVNTCPCANLTGEKCNNGQACYWYSQGCFIGCPTCDHKSGRQQVDLCGLGKKATINDPKYRTVNRNATAGSEYDIYKHNPWRAPGSAPVANACGLAGGTPWGAAASEWGTYVNTSFAHHGSFGSKQLREGSGSSGSTWTLGGEAEVVWQIHANHGGGYQYRLCPINEPLTEECFQKYPLDFVQEKQAVVFTNGTRIPIQGTFVNEGTLPAGSTWAMNPIPPTWLGPRCVGTGCKPGEDKLEEGPCEPCPQLPGSDCSRCDNNPLPKFPPPCGNNLCQGNEDGASVVDVLKVPSNLPAGKYVLGWRYDCESTAQVWSNCADITLAPNNLNEIQI